MSRNSTARQLLRPSTDQMKLPVQNGSAPHQGLIFVQFVELEIRQPFLFILTVWWCAQQQLYERRGCLSELAYWHVGISAIQQNNKTCVGRWCAGRGGTSPVCGLMCVGGVTPLCFWLSVESQWNTSSWWLGSLSISVPTFRTPRPYLSQRGNLL